MSISPYQPGSTVIGNQKLLANHPETRLPDDDCRTQPSLRVRFFGRFELLRGDEVVPLGRNAKALTILKYLLSHQQRPVSQDYLMSWLWPESDPKRARWSLNSAIYAMRKLLRSELSPQTSSDYVLFDKGYYRLDPTVRVWADADEFEARYERGRYLENARRRPEAAAEYEAAIELYRDDYLVEDLYEDWTMIKREWFANAYVDMLGSLAGYYLETERYQESIQACYRLLAKDSCHEDSYRRLIECYDRLGLQGRALRQHRLYETLLRRNGG
jgi:DNA-binding SARP family transcriptional activator